MPSVPTSVLLPYLVLWAVLLRALFVKANIAPRPSAPALGSDYQFGSPGIAAGGSRTEAGWMT
jgi:hypothetical protein